MPWDPSDAYRHTHKAKSPKAKRQWSHVSNSMLNKGYSEARAIRAANSVVKKRKKKAAGGMMIPGPQPLPMGMPKPVSPLGSAIAMRGAAMPGMAPGMGMRRPRIPLAGALRNIDQTINKTRPMLGNLKRGRGFQ